MGLADCVMGLGDLDSWTEYKVQPKKVGKEEVTGEGEGGWRYAGGARGEPHPYSDPRPEAMRGLHMPDFYQVDIDWRMLTTARPKSKLEEEVFSRYVEMGRLQLARQKLEEGKEQTWRTVKVVPGRGAVVEVRLAVCEQCGDELCAARCTDHLYTSYQRQDQVQSVHQLPAPGPGTVCTPATSARTRYSLYNSYQRQDH
ncbi:uncharacterized protein LOC125179063, partial [Hyalella azteca]|uniref:Uncharacterized protein LOC125179063 n=1 Tax=Hyalella azteca TaxID=294128 RepID=A0A979FU62_HYAAZ